MPTTVAGKSFDWFRSVLSSLKTLGFAIVEDHNEAAINNEEKYAGYNVQNNANNKRINPFTALIEPRLKRKDKYDLTVVDCALVERVVLENNVAIGVVFRVPKAGSFFIRAKKEVILR